MDSMALKTRLSPLNKLLIFLLVGIICYAILLSYVIGTNPVPTYWAASIDYGRQSILDTGNIYDPIAGSGSHTWQSDLRSYGAQDVLPKIFFAIINLMAGDTQFPGDLTIFNFVPVAGLFLIPLTLMAFYSFIAKSEANTNFFDLLLIFLLGIFPLASMVTAGSSNGTMLARGFFLLIIFLMATSANDLRKILLLCFILAVYFLIYHTWSYYLLIIVVIILIASPSLKKRNMYYVSLYAIAAYLVIGWCLNFYQLIYLPAQSILHMLSLIGSSTVMVTTPSKDSYLSVDPGILSYTSFSSLYSYLQLADVLLLSLFALPVWLAFLYNLWKDRPISYEHSIMTMVLMATPFCLLTLYAIGGITTVELRGMEILVFIFILAAAYSLAYLGSLKNRLFVILTRVVILMIIAICVWSYISQPAATNTSLDDEEYYGLSFAGHHIPANESVFSDFRLGATLIYYDMDRIYTIDSTTQIQTGQFNDILSIYNKDVEPAATLDGLMGPGPYYVMASARQSNVSLVDTSMTSFLKPARKGFEANFENGTDFNKLYSSDGFSIYGRTDLPS